MYSRRMAGALAAAVLCLRPGLHPDAPAPAPRAQSSHVLAGNCRGERIERLCGAVPHLEANPLIESVSFVQFGQK